MDNTFNLNCDGSPVAVGDVQVVMSPELLSLRKENEELKQKIKEEQEKAKGKKPKAKKAEEEES